MSIKKYFFSKQEQDEFETKAEFKHRIEEEALNYFFEALKYFLGEQYVSMRYDADEKSFSVKINTMLNFVVDVPRDVAKDFKANVKNFYIYFNRELKITEISVNFLGEKYFGKNFSSDFFEKNLVELKKEKEISSKTVKVNNLMFQDFDLPNEMNWNDACDYCEKLKLLGFSDWRLPELEELKIAYKNKSKFKNIENNRYWSNTTNSSRSWSLTFYNGSDDNSGSRSNDYFVRCVR